jgi:hypothetical protein
VPDGDVVLSEVGGVAAICMAAVRIRRPDALVEIGLVGVLEDWKSRADF